MSVRTAPKEPREQSLGYLRTAELGQYSYYGGLLLTDVAGVPKTFHYAEPVTPTRIQQIIYGYSLERYCRVDIVASALIAQVPEPPALFVVSDGFLLHAEKHTDRPVIALSASNESPFSEIGQYQHVNEREILLQATPAGGPLRVTMTHKHRKLDQVVPILCEMGQVISPLEPLERVALALEEIGGELKATLGRAA
ncbi:MAG TPA: hypothetical protein VEI97_20925 [bacterium]|nr:hypothetical protein [bacterium]